MRLVSVQATSIVVLYNSPFCTKCIFELHKMLCSLMMQWKGAISGVSPRRISHYRRTASLGLMACGRHLLEILMWNLCACDHIQSKSVRIIIRRSSNLHVKISLHWFSLHQILWSSCGLVSWSLHCGHSCFTSSSSTVMPFVVCETVCGEPVCFRNPFDISLGIFVNRTSTPILHL